MCFMEIRPAEMKDLDKIMQVYASARRYMAENGNPNQWTDGYPRRELIVSDIESGCSFVAVEGGEVHAVFAFMEGEEPTYAKIYDGHFLNDAPYGTIHRIASDGTLRGVFSACLDFCFSRINNIRIDTHEQNKIMRRLVKANGFTYCGIIYVPNGARRAYQRINDK